MLKPIFDLKDKVIVVTGAAGIQGPEHIKALTKAGAKAVATDIKDTEIKLDVTDSESIKAATVKILNQYGRIDVLINNAGATGKYATDWDQIIKVNLTGTYLCCQIVGQEMIKNNGAAIINVSSIYGLVGPDFSIYEKANYDNKPMGVPAAYCASKGGIISLTKYFASLYAKNNLRVNCVTPGGIYDKQDESFVKKYSAKTMLGRMAEKNEVSGTILYLASDLSSYVTGTNIVIDGGLTAKA